MVDAGGVEPPSSLRRLAGRIWEAAATRYQCIIRSRGRRRAVVCSCRERFVGPPASLRRPGGPPAWPARPWRRTGGGEPGLGDGPGVPLKGADEGGRADQVHEHEG